MGKKGKSNMDNQVFSRMITTNIDNKNSLEKRKKTVDLLKFMSKLASKSNKTPDVNYFKSSDGKDMEINCYVKLIVPTGVYRQEADLELERMAKEYKMEIKVSDSKEEEENIKSYSEKIRIAEMEEEKNINKIRTINM